MTGPARPPRLGEGPHPGKHYGGIGGRRRDSVTGLARADPSGGTVIERAAIVAAGADFEAVMTWIVAHGGKPEAMLETSTRHGLHGSRLHAGGGSEPRALSRFVLPTGALD